jgi:2Fe-2S ferredoxin
MSVKMCFQPTQRHVVIGNEESILDLANKARVKINQSCGGMGTCGTCRVIVNKGLDRLPTRNELEEELALSRGFLENERLACQIPPIGGLEVEIPKSI